VTELVNIIYVNVRFERFYVPGLWQQFSVNFFVLLLNTTERGQLQSQHECRTTMTKTNTRTKIKNNCKTSKVILI
jgi:hypothetical protein